MLQLFLHGVKKEKHWCHSQGQVAPYLINSSTPVQLLDEVMPLPTISRLPPKTLVDMTIVHVVIEKIDNDAKINAYVNTTRNNSLFYSRSDRRELIAADMQRKVQDELKYDIISDRRGLKVPSACYYCMNCGIDELRKALNAKYSTPLSRRKFGRMKRCFRFDGNGMRAKRKKVLRFSMDSTSVKTH